MSKYNSKKVTIDNIVFDSKVESQYYLYLKDLVEQGIVDSFVVQPKYLLQKGFKTSSGESVRPIYYVGDFEVLYTDGHVEVVDVKGLPTEGAKLKRKLFLFVFSDLQLKWVVKYKGEWVDYFENEKRKKTNKKNKETIAVPEIIQTEEERLQAKRYEIYEALDRLSLVDPEAYDIIIGN